ERLGAIGRSWGECAAYLAASPRLLLVGFEELGAGLTRWLEAGGARVEDALEPAWPAGDIGVVSAAEPAAEADAAAQWCVRCLQQDPRARLLLVVPRLAEQRHLWQRALSQRFDSARILGAAEAAGEVARPAYVLEGGQPLASYPLVEVVLQLFALAAGEARFEQLSQILRSPYIAGLDRGARAALDRWLREQNLEALSGDALRAL